MSEMSDLCYLRKPQYNAVFGGQSSQTSQSCTQNSARGIKN